MAHRLFRKTEFVQDSSGQYQVEFKKGNVGEGSDMVVERLTENGEYEVILAQIKRHEDSIFVSWSEPFDGRILFDQ
ncbi:hypothetical protein [Chryseobacterium daeguense]|uniref:hypothetical protein n=1 Tax=Chryseobacterium daeguense TaxID=412438 RepID=UPI0003F66D3C|nr:hypothetical protein [Chryseobacterium daeguense]